MSKSREAWKQQDTGRGWGLFKKKNAYLMLFFPLIFSRESGRDRGRGEREKH